MDVTGDLLPVLPEQATYFVQHNYSLSNFEIGRDVTHGKLRILGELPLNVRVVYGIAAKHERCIVTRLKYAIYCV